MGKPAGQALCPDYQSYRDSGPSLFSIFRFGYGSITQKSNQSSSEAEFSFPMKNIRFSVHEAFSVAPL